jgi:hypothetical protein
MASTPAAHLLRCQMAQGFRCKTPRFVRDGTTREDRLPNFINGRDPQAMPACSRNRMIG